jgi:hypothetical protein
VDAPGRLVSFDQAQVTVRVSYGAKVWLRIPTSPWLTLVDAEGHAIPAPRTDEENTAGCLSVLRVPGTPEDDWVVLEAPHRGVYRITAPYGLRRGTACPAEPDAG